MNGDASALVRWKFIVWVLVSFVLAAALTVFRLKYGGHEDWWFEPARDLALGVFPLGVSILVWEFLVRKDRDREIMEHVERALSGRLRRLESLEARGVVDVEPNISNLRLAEFIKGAQSTLTIFLPVFVEPNVIQQALTEKLKEPGFRAQIILFDPYSPFLRKRSQTIFKNPARGEQEAKRSLEALSNVLAESCCDRLEIRLYDGLPPLFITRSDNRALVGFYLSKGTALEHPHLIIEIADARGYPTMLGRMVAEELDRLVAASVALPDEQLKRLLAGQPEPGTGQPS